MFDLSHRVALVTGGASGIGRATAFALARCGAAVAVADIDIEGAEAVSAELGASGRSLAVPLDVTDPQSADAMVSRVLGELGRLDVLVHSAGVGVERGFLETSPEEWRRLIDVDLSGTFYCARAAARPMVEQGHGRIVLLSSAAGERGGTGRAAYGAAKGGVLALGRVMAVELSPFGVTTNMLAPGAIETELVSRMHDAETRRVYTASIPANRYGTPEEVAATAVFLASDEAGYVNGVTLPVDGGFMGAGVMKGR